MRKIDRSARILTLLFFILMSLVLPSTLRAVDNDGFSFSPSSLGMDVKPKFSMDYKNTVAGYVLVDIKITIAGDLKNLPLSITKFSSKVASNQTGTAEFGLSLGIVFGAIMIIKAIFGTEKRDGTFGAS